MVDADTAPPALRRWTPRAQLGAFVRALPALWPAAAFSALMLEWLWPRVAGAGALPLLPFAVALANTWLLAATARAQQLIDSTPIAFAASRLPRLLLCAALFWLLIALTLFTAVAVLRFGLGREAPELEPDAVFDRGFLLASCLLGYLLLCLVPCCIGPMLEERHGAWSAGPGPRRAWRWTAGLDAHLHVLAPIAAGLLLLLGLQHLREHTLGALGLGWLAALLWHALAWPAFTWLVLERLDALATVRSAPDHAIDAAATPSRRRSPAPPTSGARPMSQPPRSFYYHPDWSPEVVFVSAAVNGDVATLRRLLGEGMSANTVDHEGVAAVLRAANSQRADAVALLLAAGADPRARDRGGRSLIHLVCAYPPTLPLLDDLIARGVPIDDQHDGGPTPLMTALLAGHLDGARALLQRGADPGRRDGHGDTTVIHMLAGIYAFRSGQDHADALALLDDLLRRGVDPQARGQYGRTAVSVAAGKGLGDAIEVLRRYGAGIERTDPQGLTPLQQAWSGQHDDLVASLLADGAAVDFHSAIALDRLDQVSAALDADAARVDQPLAGLRMSPLAIAIGHASAPMIRLLLDRGADPNGRGWYGSPLIDAVKRRGDATVVRWLLDAGAELDAADGDGNTPLNFAARADRLDLAELLLEAGANQSARTERGTPLFAFAVSEPMRALLRRYGAAEQ